MFLTLALTTSLLAQVPLSTPQQEPTQEPLGSQRNAVSRKIEGLTTEVDAAMMAILAVEAKILELSRPEDDEGHEITTREDYEAKILGPQSAFRLYIEASLATFDFHGKQVNSLELGVDLMRFDAGYRAAAELVEANPKWDFADLASLVNDQFVRTKPIWSSEDADMFQAAELRSGHLAPLSNGGALGFLTWGLLRLDSYWDAEERDREAFLSELLGRGFDSRQVAEVVTRALQPPLLAPRKELSEKKLGRTIAGPMTALRAKVGFTAIHEEQLVADLALFKEIEAGDGLNKVELARRGHLKVWLPTMLALVRQELYPLGASAKMRYGDSLEERQIFWQQAFAKYGFVVAREMMLEEIRNIMASGDLHVHAARIEELLLLKQQGLLSPEQQEELWGLSRERDSDRNQLIETCLKIMVKSGAVGAGDHYELMLQTMLEDLPGILGSMHELVREQLLYEGWLFVAYLKQPKTMATLEQHLNGARDDLPSDVVGLMINNLVVGDYPGKLAVLHQIVEMGSPIEAAEVFRNPGWMPEQMYRDVALRMIETIENPKSTRGERIRMFAYLMSGFTGYKDKAPARALLLKTIEDGHWADPSSTNYWASFLNRTSAPGIKALLGPAKIATLKAEGKLAPELFN